MKRLMIFQSAVKRLLILLLLGLVVSSFNLTYLSSETVAAYPACSLAVLWQSGEISQYHCLPYQTVEQAMSYLSARQDVQLASPLEKYQLSIIPNDPGYEYQSTYLDKIKVQAIWDLPLGNYRPIIAILDSGVDITNPDLEPNLWSNPWEISGDKIDNDRNGYIDDEYGWDFINESPDPKPKFEEGWTEVAMQHGTVVAGVAAAVGHNRQGVAGVAWQARIMPLRALNAQGVGNTVTVARAINYAVSNRADIINLSFVGPHSDPILQEAISRAFKAGVLIVAASGNEKGIGVNLNKEPKYPVCDDGLNGENQVIGVAAVDDKDVLAEFSNYGSKCIDLSAPGVRIFSTQFQDTSKEKFKEAYGGWWSGTSVAAPMVSGALALLKSVYPRYTASQLRDILIASGDLIERFNLNKRGQIGRRLNVQEAFKLAGSIKFTSKSPIIVGPASKLRADIQTYDQSGTKLSSFLAYHPSFEGGVNLAAGDITGNGQIDIVIAPRAGGGPHVRVFNQQGELENEFMAFPEGFYGGVTVAAADFTGDGKDDIVIGVGKGGIPTVRIFSAAGILLHQFIPYDITYLGGVNVAAGDVDSDGMAEVIVAPQQGDLPIRIFDRFGKLKSEFKAYPFYFKGGINIAVGDLDGNGDLEIITAPGAGGGPQVRFFNWQGRVLSQYFVYAQNFRGGVNLAAGDVDGDGFNELITTPGPGGGPHIRVFNKKGEVRSQFFLNSLNFQDGLTVAVF
ncbi:MAG: S8 family serine peptidase [Patescibacteria group bacterium]